MRLALLMLASLTMMPPSASAQDQPPSLSIRVVDASGSTTRWSHMALEIQDAPFFGTVSTMHLKAQTDELSVARFELGAITSRKFRISFPSLCSADGTFSRDEVMSTGVIADAKNCDLHITSTLHAKPGELIVFARTNMTF